jgi:hypothetical protein
MLTHRSREQGSGTPGRGGAARVRACSGEGEQGIGAAGSGTRVVERRKEGGELRSRRRVTAHLSAQNCFL